MPSSPIADARFIFFGGKGGVGKTTCAAATALALASNRRVLALSLDPAPSLRDIVGPRSKLDILELDARQEFACFMDQHRPELRTIADRGTYFDDEDIQGFLDLSLPGLDEIMALLKLGELAQSDDYERVVVDLPPTGHALRLFDISESFERLVDTLELMQDKHRFTVTSLTRRYAPDGIDSFIQDLRRSCTAAQAALFAEHMSAFVLVAQPQPMVMAETARYAERLRALGAPPSALVLNAAEPGGGSLPVQLAGLPVVFVPWLTEVPAGAQALTSVFGYLAPLFGRKAMTKPQPRNSPRQPAPSAPQLMAGLNSLLRNPPRLLIFGGKGGTGKTTMAAATALALARQQPERPIVVVSIDPAHSLGDSLGQRLTDRPRRVKAHPCLRAVELDPAKRWQDFRKHWASEGQQLFGGLGGTNFDPVYDRQIAQQLSGIQPTGLDELQAATAVIDLLNEDSEQLVIVDGAPTGHLIRFLESPELVLGWAKEIMRVLLKYKLASQLRRLSEDLLTLTRQTKALQTVLHNPQMCELVVVTIAQPAVISETERLLGRLRDMKVAVRRVIVNQATDEARTPPPLKAMKQRHPDLEFIPVTRQPKPVQGIQALEALAA